MKLTLIGLGVNNKDISLSAYQAILNAERVILRTENTVSCQFLKDEKIDYTSLDFVYEKSKNFDTLTKNLANEVLKSLKTQNVCYLVDGAVSGDNSCKILLNKCKDVVVYEGVSRPSLTATLSNSKTTDYSVISAYSLINSDSISLPLVVYDLDNPIVVSECKLKLLNLVGEEVKVRLYVQNQPILCSLYEIDSFNNYDYQTTLFIDKTELTNKERFNFDDLITIVKALRAPNGCPWDREQTPASTTKSLLEECYELIDAVEKQDDDKICEETGDVLLQTAFYINFLEEALTYTKEDVLSAICHKLISRHTHVFGGDNATNAEDALKVWNKNKQIEKNYGDCTGYLSDVPKVLPSNMRAEKVIKRASFCNYQLGDTDQLVEKIVSILNSKDLSVENLKKLSLYLVALIKGLGYSPEELTAQATNEFILEFSKIEQAILKAGLNMKSLTSDEVDKYRNGN